MNKLRDYQEKGVEHLVSQRSALLLDDVGLGKTAQALAAADKMRAKTILVLCPPATRYGWESEAKKWTTHNYRIHVMTRTKEWIPEKVNILIVSYSLMNSPMIVDQLKERRWTVTICDEIHWLKSSSAKRTQKVLGRGGIISKSVHVWGLSATPMNNGPIDLWQAFRSMGKRHLPEKAQDWMGYTRMFCGRYKDRFGRWNTKGATNLELLNKSLFNSGFALRRTKEEVLHELPDKTFRIMPMEMGDMGAEIKWGEKLRLSNDFLGLGGAEIAEARRDLGLSKLDSVIEYVKAIEEPTVIFGWHVDYLNAISKAVGGSLYNGSLTEKAKAKSKEDFLSERTNFFVANMASAGTGLDGLQHRASHCVFAELPWTYAEIDQVSGRLHRMGQKDPVLVDLICMRGGIEEYMMKTILRKEKSFNKVFDKSGTLI